MKRAYCAWLGLKEAQELAVGFKAVNFSFRSFDLGGMGFAYIDRVRVPIVRILHSQTTSVVVEHNCLVLRTVGNGTSSIKNGLTMKI